MTHQFAINPFHALIFRDPDEGRMLGIVFDEKHHVAVFNLDKLALGKPYVVDDLPGGGIRLLQRAEGYVATIVSGQVIQREGKATGNLPGKLVRSPR